MIPWWCFQHSPVGDYETHACGPQILLALILSAHMLLIIMFVCRWTPPPVDRSGMQIAFTVTMHLKGRHGTFPVGLPNCTCLHMCCVWATDTCTPCFVWKQYSFQWEIFSKATRGNPTLQYVGNKTHIFCTICLWGQWNRWRKTNIEIFCAKSQFKNSLILFTVLLS